MRYVYFRVLYPVMTCVSEENPRFSRKPPRKALFHAFIPRARLIVLPILVRTHNAVALTNIARSVEWSGPFPLCVFFSGFSLKNRVEDPSEDTQETCPPVELIVPAFCTGVGFPSSSSARNEIVLSFFRRFSRVHPSGLSTFLFGLIRYGAEQSSHIPNYVRYRNR